MAVSPIVNSNAAQPQTAADAVASASSQLLSEQDFLNLLVAQMTAQDPLNPMSNQDMLTQMVQFSSLQANTTLQSQLTQMQAGQEFSDANSLIGRQVNLLNGDGTTTSGAVSGVDVSTGVPLLTVNGQTYALNQVLSVSNTQQTTK